MMEGWMDALCVCGFVIIKNLRSVFITAVKNQKWIRFSKEVLLVQLVATKLEHHRLLNRKHTCYKAPSVLKYLIIKTICNLNRYKYWPKGSLRRKLHFPSTC